jgi:hypothetical protein
MVEAHGLNQGNVVSGDPGLKMFLGVALSLIDLRKPCAGINACRRCARRAAGTVDWAEAVKETNRRNTPSWIFTPELNHRTASRVSVCSRN